MNDIRRTVFIPQVINGEDVIALIEVGGRVFSKEMVYRKFFEHGLKQVKADIVSEMKKRGSTEKDFEQMMKEYKSVK